MTNPDYEPGQEWDQVAWDRVDFSEQDLADAQFSRCTFTGCDFSSLRLTGTRLEECRFVECNLSNTVVDHTRFDGVRFEASKLVGLNFGAVDPLVFGLAIDRCLVRYGNFSQLRWKSAVFTDCDAFDTDFRGGLLAAADFRKTRFRSCRFSGADLTGANFSWAEGYDLDLRTEKLRKAQFTLPEALNLLAPFDLEIS